MKAEGTEKAPDAIDTPLNRRTFFKCAGIAGAGLASAALMGGKLGLLDHMPGAGALGMKTTDVHAWSITDVDILNFALNLEYLEAEFYTKATTGKTIEEIGIGIDGTGEQGRTWGGEKVRLTPDHDHDWDDKMVGDLDDIAAEITYDEQQHVILLRAALGSAKVAKPEINLDALGFGFENFRQFLKLARAFEDTGVSAYGGAAPLLSSKAYLATAVRIGLAEALHAANLRLLVAENHVRVSALDKQDVLPPPSGDHYFTVNKEALAIVRTPSEVLAIVLGSSKPGTDEGGFFPDGLNGKINTV